MKNKLIILVLLMTANLLTAQNKKMEKLTRSVEALREAMVDGDRAQLEMLADEDLSYGHSSGRIETKAEFVENIASGNSNFESIELSNQNIVLHKDTGIVRHDLYAKTNDKGKGPGEVKLHILTVWVKEGKDWKLISRQAVKNM